ncbi:hypothetical protein ETH_00032140 [Eimeria tenella]|uniref:Uncharacterized protein n=1 Tax=Eimeria tenella TaxID=5802 RepID=U6L0I9_EIMTE|nr:hypothetical protein ETH_00032140 [Eimeria tenella]CDJ42708.1 hypothetical protein ETH_00032140 [Eimeria tenella]|eukprot:XP_013233458.1 hypothetical protein ETH_00032140 [Eimeria tenella]
MMHPSSPPVQRRHRRQKQQQEQLLQSCDGKLTGFSPKRRRSSFSRRSVCEESDLTGEGLPQQDQQHQEQHFRSPEDEQQEPQQQQQQQQRPQDEQELNLQRRQKNCQQDHSGHSMRSTEERDDSSAAATMISDPADPNDSSNRTSIGESCNGGSCSCNGERSCSSSCSSCSSRNVPEVCINSVVLLAIASHAARLQVWQEEQRQQQQHQQQKISQHGKVIGLLLGPRRDTANFKALSVTESAELPPSLLQRDSKSSGSIAMIGEAVLLRQALDKTLLPLGLYMAQNACAQEQLSPELMSLLTQTEWAGDGPLLLFFRPSAQSSTGLHRPPAQCFRYLCRSTSNNCSWSDSSSNIICPKSSGERELQLTPVHLRVQTSIMAKLAAEAVLKKTDTIGVLMETKKRTTETAAAAAPVRLQQQIEAFECCRRSVEHLIQYLEDVKSGACKPHPALMREALGVCKRLCRPETPAAVVADDTAAAAAAALASAADDDKYFAALEVPGGADSRLRSSSRIMSSVRTVRALQGLLQQLLPLSTWSPLRQQQQFHQGQQPAQRKQELPSRQHQQEHQLQQQQGVTRFDLNGLGALKQKETEIAAMAVLGKATMGIAAAHAAAAEVGLRVLICNVV